MPIATSRQVHIDAALTQFAIAYMQSADQFVADKVFPIVSVGKQSDYYHVFARDAFLRATARKRAPGTKAAEKNVSLSSERYSADVWGLEGVIADETRKNADPAVNIEAATVNAVVSDMLITREMEWVNSFFATSIWGTDMTGVASSPSASQFVQWSDGANSNPISDIETGRNTIWQNTGMKPNTLTVGPQVHSALKRHPLIVERYKYTTSDSVTNEMIARVLEVDRYLVAGAVQASSVEGATHAGAFVAGKGALLTHSPANPNAMTASAGMTFAWTGLFDAGSSLGIAVDVRRNDDIMADVVRAHMAFDMRVTGQPLGYFFATAVA